MTWTIRRATVEDLDALADVCRAAVGDDDYALDYLRPSVTRRVTHLAEGRDGRAVGMMVFHPCVDGSAWLGMARTRPEVRRQGVANALIESFVDRARADGVVVLRLWSEATNRPGAGSAASAGFREVGRFARLVAPAARGPPRGQVEPDAAALEEAVRGSSILRKAGGYVHHAWTFVRADRALGPVAALGQFRRWEGNLLAVEPPGPGDETLLATPWAGTPRDLFEEACRQASAAKVDRAETFVARDRDLLAEARRVGFQEGTWGQEAVLFERAIGPAKKRAAKRPSRA